MDSGHVEIHDPFRGHNGTNCDINVTSDTESTEEFKILRAYAKRRLDDNTVTKDRPHTPNGNEDSSPQTPDRTEEETKKKKKKKKGLKRLSKVFPCFKPQIKDDEPNRTHENRHDVEDRCGVFRSGGVKEKDQFEEVASRLAKISDEVPFVPPDLEADAPEDDVEKVIGLLLRNAGDRLNEKELKDAALTAELLGHYWFFEKVLLEFLKRLGLKSSNSEALNPKASPKTQIAVACEVTSRLSVMNTLPSTRLLGHGARFLRNHYSSWAEQQGGYEKVFDDEDEVQ